MIFSSEFYWSHYIISFVRWQQLELASEIESDLRDTVDWGKKWLVDSTAGKTQLVSFDWSNNNGSTDIKMDGSVLEKNHLLRCWCWPSLLNWIGVLTVSLLLKLSPRKLICSMKFLSPEVTLYFYKSTIHACMEYCCHVCAGAPSCYLEMLDKLQKQICRTVGPSLVASLEPLIHCWNIASLSLFYSITLVDVLQNWLSRFHFLFLKRSLLVILIDCMICVSPFLDVTRMSMSTVSFLGQLDSGILWL